MKKTKENQELAALAEQEIVTTFGGYAPPEGERPEFGDPDYWEEMMKWW